jgi:hypothetical protein
MGGFCNHLQLLVRSQGKALCERPFLAQGFFSSRPEGDDVIARAGRERHQRKGSLSCMHTYAHVFDKSAII